MSASIGIAVFSEAGENIDEVIRSADPAMYSVKDRGQNSDEFYSADTNELSNARLTIEREIRGILLNGDFSVCYQPLVNAITEKLMVSKHWLDGSTQTIHWSFLRTSYSSRKQQG